MRKSVLVGDVGGTKVRLAVAHCVSGQITLDVMRVYDDPGISSFPDAISQFISEIENIPNTALFALAGPIEDDGSIRLTNRSWPTVVPDEISGKFGFSRTRIVNDFAAMARAIPEMDKADFETIIKHPAPSTGTVLVTGPGTGMGVSTLIPSVTGGCHVLTGEGGHVAFAPRNAREMAIRDIIAREHGYVSLEMIVAGRWLIPVYNAICELNGQPPAPLSPKEILQLADQGDTTCEEVCRFRAMATMGAIGDAALITGAKGGIVLTVGVAERTVKWLKAPEALDRFLSRGQMSPFLADIPVSVLQNGEAPLIGAAALAFEAADSCSFDT